MLIQPFGLSTPTTGAQAQPPDWEPRSHKPLNVTKKKRKTNKKEQNYNNEKNKIRKWKKYYKK